MCFSLLQKAVVYLCYIGAKEVKCYAALLSVSACLFHLGHLLMMINLPDSL